MEEPPAAARPDLFAQLAVWRAAPPQATFAELEAAVELQLDALRVQLLEQGALAPAPDPAATGCERPRCPTCDRPLQARGEQERRLTLAGDQQVHLRRPYDWCTTYRVGLFPPG